MKALKILLILLLIVGTGLSVRAQTTRKERKAAKEAAIKKDVDNKTFTFIADQAIPLGGGTIELTSTTYDIRVTPDSVISYLPYFGRAYFDVGYNPSDQGLKFTSTKFDYTISEAKRGGWEILIKPKDVKYLEWLRFYISPSGYGQLNATTINKDAINYQGHLK